MELFNFLLKITTESLKKVIEFLFRSYKTVYYTFKRWCLKLDYTRYEKFLNDTWAFGDAVEDEAALVTATGVCQQLDGQLEWIRAQIDCYATTAISAVHNASQIDDTVAVLCTGVESKKDRANIRSKYRKMVQHQLTDLESQRARADERLEQLCEEEILCTIEKDVVNAVVSGANDDYNKSKRKEIDFSCPMASEDMDMIENITCVATTTQLEDSIDAVSGDRFKTVVRVPVINSLNKKPYLTIEKSCYPRAREFIRRYVRNKNLLLQPDELSAMTVQRYVEAFCNDLNFEEGSKAFLIQAAMVCAIIPDQRDYHRAMVLSSPELRARFEVLAALQQGF